MYNLPAAGLSRGCVDHSEGKGHTIYYLQCDDLS